MAAPIVTEQVTTRGRVTGDGGEYTRSFTVIARGHDDAIEKLGTEKAIYRGMVYTDHQGNQPDTLARLIDFDTRQLTHSPVGEDALYEVECFFARVRYSYSRTETPPINGDPRFRMERQIVSEPADVDIEGKPIINTAGEPLDPPPSRLAIYRTLVAEWIRPGDSWEAMYLLYSPFEGKINLTPFKGATKGCLLCEGIDIDDIGVPEAPSSERNLYRMTARMQYREPKVFEGYPGEYEGWHLTAANLGYRIKKNVNGDIKYEELKDETGQPIRQPAKLSDDGFSRLPDANPVRIVARRLYNYVDFNTLFTV